jgi:Family of unknown function (DUF6338)
MQALAVLLVLLPGFFSAKIVQTLCVRSKQSELDKVVEALLFSLFTYILFALTLGVELPLLILYSLILGFAWGWVINHDALLKWLRRLGFTQRSRRVSAWSDIFHILGGTVQIGLKDGRMAEGWLRCYSDEAEDAALFLESASWIDENGKIYPVDGPGILFTKESEIQFVIFLRDNPPDGRAKGPVGGQAPTV